MNFNKKEIERLRTVLKNEFQVFRDDWIDAGLWVDPSRVKYMLGRQKGKRDNHHIVDMTHLLAHRSMVSGFLEGNTSSTRSWFKFAHPDKRLNKLTNVKAYMQNLNDRCLAIASSSNLYSALSEAYADWGIFNTTVLYIDELASGPHFTVLGAGTYYLMNNETGVADVLVREFDLTVKNLVETYGKRINGDWDWSNFSERVKNLYKDGNYTVNIRVCEKVCKNEFYTNDMPEGGPNRKWVSITYECGGTDGDQYSNGLNESDLANEVYLRIQHRTRKPFIAFRNKASNNFPYGETGPTTMALGCIKSLNKKAISKDTAIDLLLRPPMQGPASLKKSYLNTNPSSYTAMDAHALAQGGAKQLFQIGAQAVEVLNQDTADLRNMVRKVYYEDLMLFLSQNPKTRTAEEVRAVMSEQQLVIGPALQALNHTLNNPLVEYLADYAINEDPYVGEPPEEIQGTSLRVVFISVFAQAQRAADLPSIDRYMSAMSGLFQATQDPRIWDKVDTDAYADLYEDRLYLPVGLNRDQGQVDAKRQQQQQQQQRQQQMTETLPAVAGAQKDIAQAQQMRQQMQQQQGQ